MSLKRYECSIYIDGAMIRLVAEPGRPVTFFTGVGLNAEELSFAFIVKEAITCLATGKPLDSHFNPYEIQSDGIIYKCQWGRTGVLRVLNENAKIKFLHATTISDAVSRKATFTCSKSLFSKLPLRRFNSKN